MLHFALNYTVYCKTAKKNDRDAKSGGESNEWRSAEITRECDEDKRTGAGKIVGGEHCCPRAQSVIRLNDAFHGTALFETSAA